jgi:intracellular sulfur oxidation DsrE/DsrF family protein
MKLLINIACTGLLVIGTSIFPTTVVASDFEGIKQVKVVWDITAGDEKVFTDRIGLIRETAEDLKDRGLRPEFVLAIHGPATKYVAKSLVGTKYEKDKIGKLDAIQTSMDNLKKDGMKIEVCAIAMKRSKIEDRNVQPFAVIESNVLENIVVLQNRGYAYMPVF